MLPRKFVPSLNIETTSMSLAPVLNTLDPEGNLTSADPSVPKVAVLDPVPACVIMMVQVPPVGRLVMLNSVFVPSVTVCILAVAQLTVIVLDDVSAFTRSLNPALKVTVLLCCDGPSTSIPSLICITLESLDYIVFVSMVFADNVPDIFKASLMVTALESLDDMLLR